MTADFELGSGVRPTRSPFTYEQRLERICREAVALTGAIASAIWLWDDDHAALQVVANFRLHDDYVAYGNQVATTPYSQKNAPIYRACRLGTPILTHGLLRDVQFAYFYRGFEHLQLDTIYVAPVLLNETAFGSLAIYFERHHEVGELEALKVRLLAAELAANVTEHAHERHLAARTQELAELNAVLQEKVAHLRELSHTKSDMLGILSHELRTPLTSIMGYTTLLQRQAASPTATTADFLKQIEESSKRLKAVIEDGMLASRIETGQLDISPVEFDLDELARNLMISFEPRLREKGLVLAYEGPGEPAIAIFDPQRIAQVLMNLIGNAIKFSRAGSSIALAISCSPDTVDLVVRDHGIGIPAEQLPFVFEKYFQVNSSTTRKHEGMGLGLMIARSIVEAHDGTIEVHSQPGAGTAFSVHLPRRGRRGTQDPFAVYHFKF